MIGQEIHQYRGEWEECVHRTDAEEWEGGGGCGGVCEL